MCRHLFFFNFVADVTRSPPLSFSFLGSNQVLQSLSLLQDTVTHLSAQECDSLSNANLMTLADCKRSTHTLHPQHSHRLTNPQLSIIALPNLHHLILNGCTSITSISALTKLQNLHLLDLRHVPIQDLHPIQYLRYGFVVFFWGRGGLSVQ